MADVGAIPVSEVGAILLAAFIAAFTAFWGILTQRAIASRRATLELIARSETDRDMIAAQATFIRLARTADGLEKYAELRREGWVETRRIKLVLNELEMISIGIQRGMIDFELYKRWNRSGVIRYWCYAEPFIVRLRQRTHNKALYHEFEQMYKWMDSDKKHVPKRRRWWGKVL